MSNNLLSFNHPAFSARNEFIPGKSPQFISIEWESIENTNIIDTDPLGIRLIDFSSVVLDSLGNSLFIEDRYCNLNYKKLSGESLTEEECIFIEEVDRQYKNAPPTFSNDPEYIAAKKEIEELKK